MKIKLIMISLFAIAFIGCSEKGEITEKAKDETVKNNETKNTGWGIERIKELLEDGDSDKVMVVSHRGDWRRAPENSLQAIELCIEDGIDIVEIDIRKTKDGTLILMHDETLDRTTTGQGRVDEMTLDEIKKLYLTSPHGLPTRQKVPTLEEALMLSKGKIMLNVDKAFDYFQEIYDLTAKLGVKDHILYKTPFYGEFIDHPTMVEKYGNILDSIYFMPVIYLQFEESVAAMETYLSAEKKPVAIEFVFSNTKEVIGDMFEGAGKMTPYGEKFFYADSLSPVLKRFPEFRDMGIRVWVNSMWSWASGGMDDELALDDPDSSWGKLIDLEVNMFQTDYPEQLVAWLRKKGLHD